MHSTGQELLVDLYDCAVGVLNDPPELGKILLQTAQVAGFQVVSRVEHQFAHHGVTIVLILSQSHLALHTWPEDRFAAADVYVCGDGVAVSRALDTVRDFLVKQFQPRTFSHHLIERGQSFRLDYLR